MTVYKLSLSDAQADRLADYLTRTSGEVDSRVADEIRSQIPKPGVDEPTELWSVIFANVPGSKMLEPKQLVRLDGESGWVDSQGNGWGDFDNFSDVEVLRAGMGPEPLAQWEAELLGMQERRDIAAAVLGAMDVDQYLIDAVRNARPL